MGLGEYDVLYAIYHRLADPTLLSLAPGGVWLNQIPTYDEMKRVTVDGSGNYVVGTDTLVDPTWIEIALMGQGTRDFAPGEHWKDVNFYITAKSFSGPSAAGQAEERADALLSKWTPTIPNWPNRWEVVKIEDLRNTWFEEAPVSRWMWLASGNWRFRFGKPE